MQLASLAALAALSLPYIILQNSIEPWLLAILPLLVWVIIVDTDRMIIPDLCNGLIALLGLAATYWKTPSDLPLHIYAAMGTLVVLLLIAKSYRKIRGYSGLGMGDIKLLSACALWVGPAEIGSIVLLAAGAAIVFSGALSIATAKRSSTQPLPFGPFIALALWFQLSTLHH